MATMYEEVLKITGFAESSHLITRESMEQIDSQNQDAIEQKYRYSMLFKHPDGPDAIYEIGGIPQIYFRGLHQPTEEEFAHIHRFAWNRGDAPLLWVITPNEIRIYSSYSRPTSELETGPKHLIEVLENINQQLETYHREAFDTGEFWKTEKTKLIQSRERVDQKLLSDIQGTTDELHKNNLTNSVAHALVGQTIFLAYLRDRELLHPDLGELTEVFKEYHHAMEAFAWLKNAFNGDLFPISADEEATIQDSHIETLRQFLLGTDMKSGQRLFWPYKFDVIPIELISSIYEMFAHDEEPKVAKARSVHYTPPFLARMMLSEAMKNLNSQAIVLDPACGSGVFLVEAFKRLAYLRGFETGHAVTADELKGLLTSQIYGIELSREAAKITAFSLYLALLEMQPDIQTSGNFQLPHLLERTIFVGDTFDQKALFNKIAVFKEKRFNLVIGNPPWTSWKGNQELGIKYCQSKELPIADKKPYQAFIWRISDFASENTEVCLLVHAGMFFQQKAVAFRQAFLNRYTLRAVINLSDLRKLAIFQKVTAPAAILFFGAQPPEDAQNITYCCPKWTSNSKVTKQLMLNADDVVAFPLSTPLQSETIWKTAFWGTARDYALLKKLQQFGTLGEFLQREGLVYGQGYTKVTKGSKVLSEQHGKPWLQSRRIHPYRLPANLPKFSSELKLYRTGKKGIYQGPLIVVNRGMQKGMLTAAFHSSDLVYDQKYYGIVISSEPSRYGYYLSAILNSKFVAYFQFLTSSLWGIERDIIALHDLLRTPVPVLSKIPEYLLNQVLEKSQWLYNNIDSADNKEIAAHQSQLDQLIYRLYNLTRAEEELVEDTLSLTVDFFQKREKSDALYPPSPEHLKEYAFALIGVLNTYSRSIGKQFNAVVFEIDKSPLRMVKLTYEKAQAEGDEVQIRKIARLNSILRELADNLQAEIADNLAVRRSLRIYEGTDIYILQPAERRYWSRSAGRNEANRILKEHYDSGIQ